MTSKQLLGVDTGGTFTDFVLFDGERLTMHKCLSTPHAPEQAILKGIEDLGLTPTNLTVVHGSTVATNAALEGKGVRTAFITNKGLGDTLTIGRQARRELYNLQPQAIAPPVPEQLCLETGGRLGADGQTVEALSNDDLQQLITQLKMLQPQAIAISLLFSFVDDRFEKQLQDAIAKQLGPNVFICRSSEVLPEYKEYERGIATWLNAWVGPLVAAYLDRLLQRLPQSTITVMQSSGGTIAAEQAGQHAVHMLLSGPAGGLAAARFIGGLTNNTQLMTFDMGGTSSDVALIDGELRLTNEGRIGPYPVAVPMVDMHTIGAGGGSIAFIDDGGMLQVGPESAGADPGPACYGRGGMRATVTDANLILGRLRPDAFLGGRMSLDITAARDAIASLSAPLGLTLEETAQGIIDIANEHMVQALRVISIEKGHDPQKFTLMPFGGAGGLHVCALARALAMDSIIVPTSGGVLSALGMLAAPRSRELSRTIARAADTLNDASLTKQFEQLNKQARQALIEEGISDNAIESLYSLDLRYQGQAFGLNIPWPEANDKSRIDRCVDAFHQLHEQRYGHRLSRQVDVVTLRLRGQAQAVAIELPKINAEQDTTTEPNTAVLTGIDVPVPVYHRPQLSKGNIFSGPALIVETVATTFIEPGWIVNVDDYGNLLLKNQKG